MVLGRELLPKFSNVTKIFSNSIDGLPALAPSALDGSPTLAPSALDGLPALPPPLALAFKIGINIESECYIDDGHTRSWRDSNGTWMTLFSLVRIAQTTMRPRR